MSNLLTLMDKAKFYPQCLNGLQLWLDASDTSTITENAGSVSQWDDKSGQSNHVTQGTGSAQPTTNVSTQNSKNVLDFDGSDTLVLPSALYAIPNGSNTVFIVAKRTSEDASISTLVHMDDGGVNDYFCLYGGTSGDVIFVNRPGGSNTITNTNSQSRCRYNPVPCRY